MRKNQKVMEVQEWFKMHVSYNDEPYAIDYEQVMAVIDESFNTIVVARAGSGKTRTLVAKIVYLISKCNVNPNDIMAFVFNSNASVEINERLAGMRVDGEPVINKKDIAITFHAFSRRIVYGVYNVEKYHGKILADEKERFISVTIRDMINDAGWKKRIADFVRGDSEVENSHLYLSTGEMDAFSKMMTAFINRAQQKFLAGEKTLSEYVGDYVVANNIGGREKEFIELGAECYRRYHWYLLNKKARNSIAERMREEWMKSYETDFNLIVSWASELIIEKKKKIVNVLADKKILLIDEYQDYSQLFLTEVEAIRSVAKNARLFVVGDDWQAINRFAGSEVDFFKNFEKYFVDAKRLEIGTNYRCDNEIVKVARKFMKKSMGEKGSFRAFSRKSGKVIILNPRETEVGYALVPYDMRVTPKDRILREAVLRMGGRITKRLMVQYLKTVVEIVRQNNEAKEILILHRNNEMNIGNVSLVEFGEGLKWALDRLNIIEENRFEEKIQIMTIHKSKGLEAEVVIILEANEGVIPKVHPVSELYALFNETKEAVIDDQKRLFYVAMTRAKRKLYIISEGGGFMKYLAL